MHPRIKFDPETIRGLTYQQIWKLEHDYLKILYATRRPPSEVRMGPMTVTGKLIGMDKGGYLRGGQATKDKYAMARARAFDRQPWAQAIQPWL